MVTKILIGVALIALLASAALADTLVLKNGSVLKGTFVGFENGVFLFRSPAATIAIKAGRCGSRPVRSSS
jgi:hypothetical protein